MANIEKEFLPFLNNWSLLFVVVAFLGYYAKINYIDPKLKVFRNPSMKRNGEGIKSG